MDVVSYILSKGYVNSLLTEEGLQGKSAYEVAVDNGFEGTEEEWLKAIEESVPEKFLEMNKKAFSLGRNI